MLGTFITEWDQGKLDNFKLVNTFTLNSDGTKNYTFADKLGLKFE